MPRGLPNTQPWGLGSHVSGKIVQKWREGNNAAICPPQDPAMPEPHAVLVKEPASHLVTVQVEPKDISEYE